MPVKYPLYAKYINDKIGWAILATRALLIVASSLQVMIRRGSTEPNPSFARVGRS